MSQRLASTAVSATRSKPRRVASSSKGKPAPSPPAPNQTAGSRWIERHADRLWSAGVGAIATALFIATFSSNVQFGDSAESIAGVKVTGIVHAPGYVSYIVAAKIFTLIEPFGSLAFR